MENSIKSFNPTDLTMVRAVPEMTEGQKEGYVPLDDQWNSEYSILRPNQLLVPSFVQNGIGSERIVRRGVLP